MRRSLLFLSLSVPLALAGCSSDFGLGVAPEGIDGGPGEPVFGPGGPTGPIDPPAPPSSPWDNIDPGTLPDVHFAVAHHEYDCQNMDGDGGADPGLGWESDVWMECPGTYAVIDLEGQVIAEFSVPMGDNSWSYVNHLELRPAGPGRFLALVENWSEDGAWGEDEDSDGVWVSPYLQVWMADAVAGTMQLLVEMQDPGRTALVHTNGRQVRLTEGMGTTMIGLWPEADETKLVVWEGNNTCETGVGSLRAVEMGAAATLDWVWGRNELLPQDMHDACAYEPWNMAEGIDEQGNPSLLLGVSEVFEDPHDDGPVYRQRLVAWSPDQGPMWDVPVSGLSWPFRATYSGWNGGGALWISNDPYAVGQYWHVVGPETVHEGSVQLDFHDARPGPLLDPQGPTFLMFGRVDTDWKHSIRLVHRDQVTWSIDHLRFGLNPQRRFISDVVLMLPVE